MEILRFAMYMFLRLECFQNVFLLVIALCVSKVPAYFISIDCGATTGFTDDHGITWHGDSRFILSGLSANITTSNGTIHPAWTTLRYFTTRKKNCYAIPDVGRGIKYLVRATFYYGNYDGKSLPPSFSLQFDGNHWDNVTTSLREPAIYEMVYFTKAKSISVCVAQTEAGQIPFISAIEIRELLPKSFIGQGHDEVLFTIAHTSFGLPTSLRYPDDKFDRIWVPGPIIRGLTNVTADSDIMVSGYADEPPTQVLLHAVTPLSNTARSMSISNPIKSESPQYIDCYFHFAEVSQLAYENRNRSFYFVIDGINDTDIVIPPYQTQTEYYFANRSFSSRSTFVLQSTENSTLPPLINGMEFFVKRTGLDKLTNYNDTNGLRMLQSQYEQLKSWGGDPCLPANFTWEWLGCNYMNDRPRVTALFLNGYGLRGTLADFSPMVNLEIIDFHNNSLNGTIPSFLGQMTNLKVVNLASNNFVGSVPCSLANNPNISLNISGNPDLRLCGTGGYSLRRASLQNAFIIFIGAAATCILLFI